MLDEIVPLWLVLLKILLKYLDPFLKLRKNSLSVVLLSSPLPYLLTALLKVLFNWLYFSSVNSILSICSTMHLGFRERLFVISLQVAFRSLFLKGDADVIPKNPSSR
jgi:hypothetical protein